MVSRIAAFGLLPSVASGCLQWAGADATSEDYAYSPGVLKGKKQGVCRFVNSNVEPFGAEVGKWEDNRCFFTGQGGGFKNVNGSADFDDGFELVVVDTSRCIIDDTTFIAEAGQALPDNVAVAGFRMDGAKYGVCLAPDGEGEGSLIPGPLHLEGPRRGQCCWSAHFQENCRDFNYRVVTGTEVVPPPRPVPAPEPIPDLLEPNARIFSVRLSFGPRGDPGIMGLTFETPNTTFSSHPNYTSVVWWATSLERLQGGSASMAKCSTSEARSCFTDSPFTHYCNMSGLDANTKYWYAIGDQVVGWTPAHEKYSFTTPPIVGQRGPLVTTAVAFGDMGLDYSDRTRAMLARMAKDRSLDFTIHNGDISYADNNINWANKSGIAPSIYLDWMDLFYANISETASRVPYMMSPGNHEAPCNYGEYEARAGMMPFGGSNSPDMQYYSYTVGQTHIIALSGEQHRLSSINSTEMQWLEKDLAAAAAAREKGDITFIITHVHYPNSPAGYCSSKMTYCCANGRVGLRSEPEGAEHHAPVGDGDCAFSFMTEVNKYAENLFVQYGVDVHLTAHQHVYERTTPVYRYEAFGNGSEPFPEGNDGSVFVNPKFPINVNNGNPGDVELQDVWLPKPEWSVGLRTNADGSGGTVANNYADFGVCKFIMRTGDQNGAMDSLTMQYVTSRDGSIMDEFTLYKDRPTHLRVDWV